LITRSRGFFQPQLQSSTRWIDPIQYDWPCEHFQFAKFPWDLATQRTFAFPFDANISNTLANQWDSKFQYFLNRNANIVEHWPDSTFDRFDANSNTIFVQRGSATHSGQAHVVLHAHGFGVERTWAGKREDATAFGPPFWSSDSLTEPNFGLPQGTKPRVLISGSGDGAIQDFLRIACKSGTSNPDCSAASIYRRAGIPNEILQRATQPSDFANRVLIWGHDNTHDHQPRKNFDTVIKQLVDDSLNISAVFNNLDSILRDPNDFESLAVVHECTHLTPYYPLNWFLARLIDAFWFKKYKGIPRIDANEMVLQVESALCCNKRISRVDCDNHSNPNSDWLNCIGKNHRIYVWDKPDCRAKSNEIDIDFGTYNVLILRNGLELSDDEKLLSPKLSRQLMPYALPKSI
jgi:hypothetical protein